MRFSYSYRFLQIIILAKRKSQNVISLINKALLIAFLIDKL